MHVHFSFLKMTFVILSQSHNMLYVSFGTGVFYCGAPVLAKELSKLCYEFNQKGSTKFEFHKEHF